MQPDTSASSAFRFENSSVGVLSTVFLTRASESHHERIPQSPNRRCAGRSDCDDGGLAPALSQAVKLVIVDVAAVAEGYRASKLIETDVVNDQNERIGTIDDIIIGRDRVLFAVLQVGGFLGLGGHLVAVPYQTLVLDHPDGKIVLPGATRDELRKLPEFRYSG